jgi:hypothetical protein
VLTASPTVINFIIVLSDIAQRAEVTVVAETGTQDPTNRPNTKEAFSHASPSK